MNNDKKMCDDCEKLKGAHRHISPHENLVYLDRKEYKSIMGSADETYYKCRACGCKWMRETGSCGMGWVGNN